MTKRENPGNYDEEARAYGWSGPAVVFGLAYPYIRPGEAVLDIGIGTGLGSERFHKAGLRITGLDISECMLEACRKKGIAALLVRHDLAEIPYPFGDASFDHAVSMGVFQFFRNLSPVIQETGRVLREGGVFTFVTGDRHGKEKPEVIVGPEQSGTGRAETIYRHSLEEVTVWLDTGGFKVIDTVEFTIWMDRQRSERLPARAILARKTKN